jgi:Hypervirulence associated proteins TUDOR domain
MAATAMEKIMENDFKKGDKVEWNTSQGKTTGVVEKKLTSPIKIKGHQVQASEDNPEYLVKSDKTGSEAAHKPDALNKIG